MNKQIKIYFQLTLLVITFSLDLNSQSADSTKIQKAELFSNNEFRYSIGIGNVSSTLGLIYENDDIIFGFRSITGFRFKNKVSLGLGLGIEISKGQSSILLFPITFDGRYYLSKGNFSPFFNLNSGYSFGRNKIEFSIIKGGWNFNPSIGIQKYFNRKKAFDLSLGYLFLQRRVYGDPIYYGNSDVNIFSRHYISLNLGITL
jgi:hypothetical protein